MMEKSLEDRLAEGIARRFPISWGLQAVEREGGFAFVVGDGPPILTLSFDKGEWTVAGEHGHAHLDDFEEATALSLSLLAGESRFANEYRGDVRASDWIEVSDGGAFEARHVAAFLSPFDRDEWDLRPGERWRVVRTVISLGPERFSERAFERIGEGPSGGFPRWIALLEAALGRPEEAMRWTILGGHFVFQAPAGWRRRPREPDASKYVADFADPIEGLVFRARCYFRPAESPRTPPAGKETFRAESIEHTPAAPSEDDPSWAVERWTLLFSSGEEEMMAIVEGFAPRERRWLLDGLRKAIERSVQRARYVPGSWTMHPESDERP